MTEDVVDVGASLGCLDGLFAKRLMRCGPTEVHRMFNKKSPLFSAVVEYKWNSAPDVVLARKLNRLLRWVKFVDPEQYKQYKKQILTDIKADGGNDDAGYREFVQLIDNPKLGKKRYDGFVAELLDNSPKTRDAVLKLSERDAVLAQFGLDYRSDYIVNDSKKIDVLLLKMMFFLVFCRCNANLIFKYIRSWVRLNNDKARLEVAGVLWTDWPEMIAVYQRQYNAQQELYDFTKKTYRHTVNETKESYKEAEKNIDIKHQSIARYKELIKTGQLPVFKKK